MAKIQVVCQYINTFATLGHRLPALDTLTTRIISHSKQLFLNMFGRSKDIYVSSNVFQYDLCLMPTRSLPPRLCPNCFGSPVPIC